MATWKSAVERSKIGQGHQFSPSNQCVGGDAPIFQGRMEPFPLQKIEPIITFYIKRHGNTEKILTLGHDSDESVIRDYTRFLKHLRCGRVILLTHGFLSGCDKDWLEEMKDALLGVDKQIVALVGWKGGAHVIKYDAMDLFRQPNPYIQAAANCLAVGAWVGKVGKVATWLAKAMGSEKDCLWRIGHSLGAHLMGKAGESAKKLMSTSRPVFDRITAHKFCQIIYKNDQTLSSRKYLDHLRRLNNIKLILI
ncbi:phospholipase A1 4-like [Folsomia candida]|uniref:phospholipase A1 4-like n=1 Tax=Folsomia candida TaxID=158441 RepID=UPI001604C6AE|nr:phospholipase A1 4-like [Folsomia candida]